MNIFFLFTFGNSLDWWYETGLFNRETSYYKALSQKGVNVNFLTFGGKKDLVHAKLISPIKVYPTQQYLKSNKLIIKFIRSLFLPFKLKQLFQNIEIIKTNQIRGSWIACISKIFFRNKIIIRAGFELLTNHKLFFRRSGIKRYLKYLFRYMVIFIFELFAYKLADEIILTSEQDIEFIVKCFNLKKKLRKNHIHHFYNFIDENLFKNLELEKKDKHILYIGRLSHVKNLENLFQAIKDLDDITLDIIGRGPDEERLKKLARDMKINCRFLGVFPNDDIPSILNQYHIFILPSLSEGNPKALLEAMSCEIACIGTNVKGIKNIIAHEYNGYLCGTSSNSIKRAIQTLSNNHILREKIGTNARKFILENCTLESVVNKEFQLYKRILNIKLGK